MADPFPGRPGGTNPLTRNPLNESWEYDVKSINSATDGMYDTSRAMSTRKRKIYTVSFDSLPNADVTLIEDHFKSVGLGDSFAWVDINGTSHTVRYTQAIKAGFVVEGYQAIEPLVFKEI